MNLSFIKKQKRKTAPMHGLLSKNPVLINGLALAPVIVASTTVKNALVLSIGMAITMIPTMLISLFIKRKQGHWLHILLYMFCAAISYIPAALLIRAVFSYGNGTGWNLSSNGSCELHPYHTRTDVCRT